MSKIFDMLNRGKGEIADLIRPMVETPAEPKPPVRKETVSSVASPPKPDTHAAPEATVDQASADKASRFATVRTLSLRLPSPSPLLPFEDGYWRSSEQYRILRTKISQHPKQPHVIVVSSPNPGDGKSVTAINTAGTLSLKSDGLVLLMDADLRKSAIHTQLGLPEAPGLVDVIRGNCTLEDALVRAQEFPNLYVLSAGAPSGNPVELLDSAQWQALCATLRGLFRYVVLDSPPVGAVADYDLIQAVCDGVILVVRPDHTNRQLCQKALDVVPQAKLLGVLLNCAADWPKSKYVGADYYYYSKGKASRPAIEKQPKTEAATEASPQGSDRRPSRL